MKKVRLEIPLGEDLNTTVYKHRRVFLKVGNSQTRAFYDKNCKQPIFEQGPKLNLDIEMPDEIGLISVAASSDSKVSEEIANAWFALFHIMDRFKGLKEVCIIAEDNIYDVNVCNERPNVEEWLANKENDWWHSMSWGLVVYVYESKSVGILRWSSKLAEKTR